MEHCIRMQKSICCVYLLYCIKGQWPILQINFVIVILILILVSPRRYVNEFRSLAVSTPPLQMKGLIFIRITDGLGGR